MIKIFTVNASIKLLRPSPCAGSLCPAPGFTLIELMITISIAAILLAIGIPSMRDMIQQNRLTGNVNEFVAANMLARSEAIKRGTPVTLCRSVNAESASGSNACSGTAGDWNTGWIVVVPNDDSPKNEILARQRALPAGTTVTATLNAITYTGVGPPAAGDSFTFINDCKLEGRNVVLSRSGHISVGPVAAAGC